MPIPVGTEEVADGMGEGADATEEAAGKAVPNITEVVAVAGMAVVHAIVAAPTEVAAVGVVPGSRMDWVGPSLVFRP